MVVVTLWGVLVQDAVTKIYFHNSGEQFGHNYVDFTMKNWEIFEKPILTTLVKIKQCIKENK